MKILIVSTTGAIDRMLGEYIINGELPDAEYTLVQERFGEEPIRRTYADHYIPIYDIGDSDEIRKVAKECDKYGRYDFIVQTDEYAIILAEKIKSFLNYSEGNVENVLKFRDKQIMKQHIHSVKTPRMYSVEELRDNPKYFPVIIKPRSFAASNGIYKVSDFKELLQIIDRNGLKFLEYNSNYDYFEYEEAEAQDIEIEEYVVGSTYHIDGFIFGGEIGFCVANQYINSCLDFSKGIPLGSIYISDSVEQKEWLKFTENVCKDLTVPDGAFHIEAFMKEDGTRVFLEAAIRCGGGLIPDSTNLAQGVDLNLCHIQCQLGIKPHLKVKNHMEYGFLMISNVLLPNNINEVIEVNMPSKIIKTLVNLKIPRIGDIVERHNNYNNLIGEFMFQSNEKQQIIDDMTSLMERYSVTVKEKVE